MLMENVNNGCFEFGLSFLVLFIEKQACITGW